MISPHNKRQLDSQKLIILLDRLQGATSSGADDSIIDDISNDFFQLMNEFNMELLPYGAISQFVFRNNNSDVEYFFEKLQELIEEKYSGDLENPNYFKSIKLLEHLDLANQQSVNLFQKHEREISRLRRERHQLLKVSRNIEKMENELVEIKTKTEHITTNLISILGIFAAILMGAFGAIQAFTSLFTNAAGMPIGKLLIISSLGASSVILILFFLLNGIAKLTNRSLWSTNKENGTLLEKHPSLVIVHGILIFVSMIGAALELSNVALKIAWQGLWWIIPLIWISYLLVAVHKQDYLFFVTYYRNRKNKKGDHSNE